MSNKLEPSTDDPPHKSKGKKKIILILIPVALIAIAGGGWLSGFIPKLLQPHAAPESKAAAPEAAVARAPVFVELPDIIANLNTGSKRAAFIKLKARLELAKPEDQATIQAAMPKILDLFQTYLREMRPEEMRSSASTYRLREELVARSNIAGYPARVVSVLFTEIIVQ